MKAIFRWLALRSNRFFLLLLFFVAGLMFSKALLSLSVAVIALNWIVDNSLKRKFQSAVANKALLAFLAIFFMHIAALAYTTDFQYALLDIKIKLPLLVLPLVFATESPLSKKQIMGVLHFFFIMVILSSLCSLVIYAGNDAFQLRTISPFMSHIRLGIITTIAAAFMFYQFYKAMNKTSWMALAKLFGSLWLAFFTIVILGSVNGVVFFTSLLCFWIVVVIFKTKKKLYIVPLLVVLVSTVFLPAFYIINIHNSYFPSPVLPHGEPSPTTQNGNYYLHEHFTPEYENGIPVYGYYCKSEFIKQWNKRSDARLDDTSVFSPIGDALVRYLSSKNLPKDSVGVAMLTDEDIANIEKGIPNYKLAGKTPLEYRLYELFRGYYFYRNFENPNNNSLFMRLEFWKAARGIIKKNPAFGVGTGDVNHAFEEQYSLMNSQLEQQWRLRAHNQYISFTVAFGFIGLLVFLFSLLYPPLKLKRMGSFYFLTVFLVFVISMVSEDTIETQIGVSMFSFFFSFFLFLKPRQQTDEQSNSNESLPHSSV